VSAHGMRGLHSTLALERGVSSHAVASALGHTSFKATAQQNYVAPGTVEKVQQRRALTVLAGGKG
jgi:integrase